MDYQPKAGVWEITYACNMRCRHCGSSCGQPLPDELTENEALGLCDDLTDLGLEQVTLSGGEPFLRPDWPHIARRLTQNGITVNAISNGWYIDENLLEQAFASGIVNIGISLDGYAKAHDHIRKKDSWKRSTAALALMQKRRMSTVVCTSINRSNLPQLPRIKKTLYRLGVQRWQLQLASPMGNLLSHPDLVVTPEDVPEIIDFCHRTMQENRIIVDLADCLGYCTKQDEAIRKRVLEKDPRYRGGAGWRGCQAGKQVIGIRANGDISPCLSIRDESFIGGNIRRKKLKEIWSEPEAFGRLRDFSTMELKGICKECPHSGTCLGGCTSLKLTFEKSLAENRFCMFRIETEQAASAARSLTDITDLMQTAHQHVAARQYHLARVYLDRVQAVDPTHLPGIRLAGFVHFSLGDYEASLTANQEALRLCPKDPYSLKGMGLCLARLDRVEEGLRHLEDATRHTDADFMAPYFDAAVILLENSRLNEARAFLDKGCDLNPAFLPKARPLYAEIRRRHQSKKGPQKAVLLRHRL